MSRTLVTLFLPAILLSGISALAVGKEVSTIPAVAGNDAFHGCCRASGEVVGAR